MGFCLKPYLANLKPNFAPDAIVQDYLASLYDPLTSQIKESLFGRENEIYGELYYQSIQKIIKKISITSDDHILDIGSGLGKVVMQLFLTTNAASVIGVEINRARYEIAMHVLEQCKKDLPDFFLKANKKIGFVNRDFLEENVNNLEEGVNNLEENVDKLKENVELFQDTTIAYVCNTVFSFALIKAIGEKLDKMSAVHTIISMRKIPNLKQFRQVEKLFVHGSWDYVIVYIYRRNL